MLKVGKDSVGATEYIKNRASRRKDKMHKTSQQEKDEVLRWIDRYVQNSPILTIRQYKRLACWLGGMTHQQIADEEGVSHQAVAQSVKRDVKKILEFAKTYDKR